MNSRSILISIASAIAVTAAAADLTPRASDTWLAQAATGRVTRALQFLPHEKDPDFFIRFLQRQYSNDMRTVQGRVKWHGQPISQELDETNRMCKIERFADGTVHVEPYRSPKVWASITNSPAFKERAAKRKAAIAKRRAALAAKREMLPGLKAAQLQTFDNKNTESNVTVNINIGGSHGRR